MAASKQFITSTRPAKGEQPFWQLAGATWRHLAGDFAQTGFSFEWHEWDALRPLKWADSFHPSSVEICLNLEGSGWVGADGVRMDIGSETVGFFACNGKRLTAEREQGQHHQFLS